MLISRKSPLFVKLTCLVAMMYLFLVLAVPINEANPLRRYATALSVGVAGSLIAAALVKHYEGRTRDLPTDIRLAKRKLGLKQGKVDKINADIKSTLSNMEKEKEKMAKAQAILDKLPENPTSPTDQKKQYNALKDRGAAKYRHGKLNGQLTAQRGSLQRAEKARDKANNKYRGFLEELELLPGRLKRAKEALKGALDTLDQLRLDYNHHQYLHDEYGRLHA